MGLGLGLGLGLSEMRTLVAPAGAAGASMVIEVSLKSRTGRKGPLPSWTKTIDSGAPSPSPGGKPAKPVPVTTTFCRPLTGDPCGETLAMAKA